MAEKKEAPGFVVYREAAIMLALIPAEDAAAAIKAACDYFVRGMEPQSLDGYSVHVYETLREGIDRSTKKYQAKSEQNRKSAEKRWQDANAMPTQCECNANAMQTQCERNANALPTQCECNANQNQNYNSSSKPRTKAKTSNTGDINARDARSARKERATPPTLESVTEYAEQRGSDVDPQQFWEYYTAGDWKDAKGNPVRNWKQKFLTWEKHEAPKTAPARTKSNPAIGTPGDYEREAIARLHKRGDSLE